MVLGRSRCLPRPRARSSHGPRARPSSSRRSRTLPRGSNQHPLDRLRAIGRLGPRRREPGRLSIASVAPTSIARSRIPRIPDEEASAPLGMPRPSSVTVRTMASGESRSSKVEDELLLRRQRRRLLQPPQNGDPGLALECVGQSGEGAVQAQLLQRVRTQIGITGHLSPHAGRQGILATHRLGELVQRRERRDHVDRQKCEPGPRPGRPARSPRPVPRR
jgi:hypothetical protein